MDTSSVAVPPTARPRTPCSLQALARRVPVVARTKNAITKVKPRPPPRLSCKAGKANDEHAVDRRDVLLAGLLGGTAAAGLATTANRGAAVAAPVQAPDLERCRTPDVPATAADPSCCMTYRAGVAAIDFRPTPSSPLRVRPAAHLVDSVYVAKYERAVALMRELPDDDPRSFAQQAHVHCAYCNGAYGQAGFPDDLDLQIHNCWLFFPWHRLYLYFHERILGKLIGDDSFALPFWNWDAPGGMTLPAIYASDSSSPLYDERRNPAHQRPSSFLDLDFSDTDPADTPRDEQVDQNLKLMYRQMVSGAKKKELFMGQAYRAGDAADPGAGTIESVPHAPLHVWAGDPAQPNGEDMGNFYSAARDPVFFAHHGNVDRLWHVWRRMQLQRRSRPGRDRDRNAAADFADGDWLDASFHFYDEEARLVRARVRDCLDTAALGYAYQDVGMPWLDARPRRTAAGTPVPAATGGGAAFPARLDEAVRVAVARPRVSRTREEKDEEEEVLVVEGVQVADHLRYVKFDVFVNQCAGGGSSTAAAECAGSFALAPHVVQNQKEGGLPPVKMAARFGITDLLDEIGADGDRTVVVSLVPRCAGDVVTVGGVSVTYVK